MIFSSLSEKCTDPVTLQKTRFQYVDKLVGKTDDEAHFTNILMSDTMDSTEPSIFLMKQEGNCGSCSKCTVWEKFSSYEDFQNDHPLDKATNSHVACYANTIRVFGGYVYCQTKRLADYNGSPIDSYMVKMNAKDGSIVAKKAFQIKGEILHDCIEDFYRRKETVIDYLVDRTGFWVLYRSYFHRSFMLQMIDPEDLSTIRRIPIDIQSDSLSLTSPLVAICGKLYSFHFDSNMVKVSVVFDIFNPTNTFKTTTTLTENPLHPYISHSRPVVHFNPMSNELFLHAVNLNVGNTAAPQSLNFRVPIVSCNSKLHVDFTFNIKSTILWSLHQTGDEQMTQQLHVLSRAFDITDMDELAKVANALSSCQNPICYDVSHSSSSLCIIEQVRKHLKIYSDLIKPSTQNVILQVSQNQRELLKQQTLRSISSKIENQLKDLSEQTTASLVSILSTMKEALPDYFNSLATFDQGKAKADADSLSMSLQSFKMSIDQDSRKIGKTLEDYWGYAMTSTTLELVAKTARLALVVAENSNPIGWITGDCSALEIMDAIAEVAKAATGFARAAKAVKTLQKVGNEFQKTANRMNKILQSQTNIKNMFISAVDETLQGPGTERYMMGFLQEYGNYDPIFTQGDFAYLGALLSELIDELCDLIFSGDSTHSAIVQTIFTGLESCIDAKSDIERLLATYDEMYDFQDDLMEAMAEFVRATVSMKSAEQISTSISQKITAAEKAQNRETKEFSIRLYALQLTVANKVHTGILVRDACNLIQYKNAGETIEFCKDLRLAMDPTSTNYDLIVAYDYAKDMCSDDFSVKVLKIPATVSENGRGITFPYTIDLERLYDGEEVTFQVPNTAWLTENQWMNVEDTKKANFIRDFELFLPPLFSQESHQELEVHIKAEMVGENRIFPGKDNKKYSFSAPTIYNFRYKDSRHCHSSHRPSNPYNTIDCPPLRQPCIVSHGTRTAAVYHPSIYSRWRIRVASSGRRLRPTPSGEFFLKAALKICHIRSSSGHSAVKRSAHTTEGQCCADVNKFYDDKSGVCQPCRDESCVRLQGYYCDRNCTAPP